MVSWKLGVVKYLTADNEEKIVRNGVTKVAHVVIKNSPFIVQVGLLCEQPQPRQPQPQPQPHAQPPQLATPVLPQQQQQLLAMLSSQPRGTQQDSQLNKLLQQAQQIQQQMQLQQQVYKYANTTAAATPTASQPQPQPQPQQQPQQRFLMAPPPHPQQSQPQPQTQTLPQSQSIPAVDFSCVSFECTLLYDTDTEDKTVDFVKVKPMEFKAIASENPSQASIELRIKVLTSQREDMLFKVRIQGLDPVTKAPLPHMRTYTCPIKVISKPEQLKKRSEESALMSKKGGAIAAHAKKRSLNEILVETVARVEQQQQQQSKVLTQLLELQQQACKRQCFDLTLAPAGITGSTTTTTPPQDAGNGNGNANANANSGQQCSLEFEQAVANMLRAYMQLDPVQRPQRVRQLVRSIAPTDCERLSEMLDMFNSEGLRRELGHDTSGSASAYTTVSGLGLCDIDDFCNALPSVTPF